MHACINISTVSGTNTHKYTQTQAYTDRQIDRQTVSEMMEKYSCKGFMSIIIQCNIPHIRGTRLCLKSLSLNFNKDVNGYASV